MRSHSLSMPNEGETFGYDLQILKSLRQIIRAIDVHSRKLKTKHNITGPQLLCLGIIQSSGSSTVTKIARQAYLSPSTVVGILDRLEHEGYVSRERDQVDRRNWNIIATSKAERLLREVPSSLHDGLRHALNKLPTVEQVEISRALARIVELLGVTDIDAAPILDSGSLDPAGKPFT